jgi:phage tail-like protein
MNGDRQLRGLAHPAQWALCSHHGTSLLPEGGVELSWSEFSAAGPASGAPVVRSGLTFDRWCEAHATGRHTSAAVDGRQRLYVADACDRSIKVVDLWARRLLRRHAVGAAGSGERRPVDVAADGSCVMALVDGPPALLLLDGRRDPSRGPALEQPCYPWDLRPARIAVRGGLVLVLWSTVTDDRNIEAVVCRPDGSLDLHLPGATDLDVGPDGTVVVARAPGQPFRRWELRQEQWIEIEPLRAEGYDGGAVSVAPNGRVAYTTSEARWPGWTWTSGSAATFAASGEVRTYRLDSGSYRTRWGRVFLEGCVPAGASVSLRFVTSDEDDVVDPLERERPDRGGLPPAAGGPPLPSQELLDGLSEPSALFERTTPPWPGEPAGTVYETPVRAAAGRYLWVVARLTGTAHATPRITALRVEAPGHRLDRALPSTWTAAEGDAAYLQRFLAPAEGLLHDLDSRAAARSVLVDPTATPDEALAWLGSFVGVALDARWPEDARRELVASAVDLFRIRGTVGCLERILRLYLRLPLVVVENWRLRGLGGGVLSAPPTGPRPPAVGAGTPLAGQLGRFAVGGLEAGKDGYTSTAHRFTVLVGTELGQDWLDVVQHIVDTFKPAHTLGEICQLGNGMRLGSSTRIGLSSFVGPSAAWGPAVVGRVDVGGDGIVGTPAAGSRLDETSHVGKVLVG